MGEHTTGNECNVCKAICKQSRCDACANCIIEGPGTVFVQASLKSANFEARGAPSPGEIGPGKEVINGG